MKIVLFIVICLVIFFAIGEAMHLANDNSVKSAWATVAMFFLVLLYIVIAVVLVTGGSLWNILV
jgi:hypothetical protein